MKKKKIFSNPSIKEHEKSKFGENMVKHTKEEGRITNSCETIEKEIRADYSRN